MPAPWEPVYTDAQREAVERAYMDRGIRPARRVVDLAAAGELDDLEPFTIPVNTVRDMARKATKRRAGQLATDLASNPDAVQILRRRLISAADLELARLERLQKDARHKVDLERLRQIARATREIAALPGPGAPRPVAPGQRDPAQQGPDFRGKQNGAATTGGLAGAILADVRRPDRAIPIGDSDTPPDHEPRPTSGEVAVTTLERNAATWAGPRAPQHDTQSAAEKEHAAPGS